MKYFLFIALILFTLSIYSQSRCSADGMFQKRLQKDSAFEPLLYGEQPPIVHNSTQAFVLRNNTVTLTIPIVVHIMTTGGGIGTPDNPSNTQIQAAVDYANLIFKGTAPNMIPGGIGAAAGDLHIEFKLAVRTPLGSSTDGIERINASCLPSYVTNGIKGDAITPIGCDELELKSLANWDINSYLNIYVVSKIDGNDGFQPGIVEDGYAYPPSLNGQPSKLDGVVILASRMNTGLATLAHEFGHYLGLYHTFRGSINGACPPPGNCVTTGDLICDTDPVTESEQPRGGINPCSGLAYLVNTEANVMSYSTRRELFTNDQAIQISTTLTNPLRSTLFRSSNMALIPPTANQFFNSCTNPDFTTNEFNCISVGKNGHVWVGTNQQGLYKYDGVNWTKEPFLSNYYINDIKSDADGGIWVAQSGSGSTTTRPGGIEYYPNSAFTPTSHFGYLNGLPGPNVRSLFIDRTTMNGIYPLVWSANVWYTYYNMSYDGGIARGVNGLPPNASAFIDVSGIGIPKDGNGSAQYVGGNATEVWVIAPNNQGNKTQVVKYRVTDNAVLGIYGYPGVDGFQTFVGKAMYVDPNNNKWIGKIDGIVTRAANDDWNLLNLPNIYPIGTQVNSNAITGDENGNVFIGTTNGLIIYRGGPLDKECSYTRYTTDNGLLSNNIKNICWDKARQKLLLATDKGIAFWSPTIPVTGTNTTPYVTMANGALNDPSTWCGGTVPPPNSNLIIKHAVTISTVMTVSSLREEAGANVRVINGGHIIVTH